MGESKCPECGAPVQPTDTHCMECGADLLTARDQQRQQLQQQSVAARTGPTGGAWTVGLAGATAGRAKPGETSEETRLRIFDQQEAKRLAAERVSVWITGVLVGIPGIAALVFGLVSLHQVGLSEVGTLGFADLRHLGIVTDARFVAVILTGLGIAGTMCAAGLARRGFLASRAIAEVKRGEKPTIVSLCWLTYYGLLLVAIFCPPLGLIVGILLKFSSDEDIKGVGGTMIILSLIVMAVLVANALLSLAEGFKSAQEAEMPVHWSAAFYPMLFEQPAP